MTFVLKMLFSTFVYDHKNENHWSLLITRTKNTATSYANCDVIGTQNKKIKLKCAVRTSKCLRNEILSNQRSFLKSNFHIK